jgi:hypothetical protein
MPSRIRINATTFAYPNLPGNPDSTQPKSALVASFEPLPSPRTDTQTCEEGTLVNVDDQGDLIDTSSPPNPAPAPPATPAPPAILEDANVALGDAARPTLAWIKRSIEPKGRSND